MDKKFIVRLLPIVILVLTSVAVLFFWTPNVLIMGNFFLIKIGFLIGIAFAVFAVYELYLLNKTSRKYPKQSFMLKDVASLAFELLILSGAFSALLHFDLLHVDNYLFLLFFAGFILSIIQKVYWLSFLVDNYKENTGENWDSLLHETSQETNSVCVKNAILVMLLLLPVAIVINISLGVSLGIIVGSVLIARLFEISLKG